MKGIMEAYIMIGILVIGFVIIMGGIIYACYAWHKRKRQQCLPVITADMSRGLEAHGKDEPYIASRADNSSPEKSTQPLMPQDDIVSPATSKQASYQPEVMTTPQSQAQSQPQRVKNDLLILSVVATADCSFSSYNLFQAIAATGMQFGDKNIFHYFLPTPDGPKKLFSLASATEQGEFDLNRIGEFSCKGLTLFAELSKIHDQVLAYKIMRDVAQQLADDLDGVIRAGYNTPWTAEAEAFYANKAYAYAKNLY